MSHEVLAHTLTFNDVDVKWTRAFVESFHRFAPEVPVVIVDESPNPATAKAIASLASEQVRVERLEQDSRVAAYNLGLQRAREAGATWALFIDSDVILLPHTVERMLAAARANPQAGVVHALVNTKHTVGWKHIVIDIPRDLADIGEDHIGWERLVEFASQRFAPPQEIFTRQCFMTDAICMLVRLDMAQELGQFDPHLVHNGFVEDLAYSMHRAGWQWLVDLTAVAFHGQRDLGGCRQAQIAAADSAYMNAKWGMDNLRELERLKNPCITWGGFQGRDPALCKEDDKEFWLYKNGEVLRAASAARASQGAAPRDGGAAPG